RFNAAGALAIPGAIAGMAFQLFYGPAHFLFDLESLKWWGTSPWEHLILWLIAGAGGGWLLGLYWHRRLLQTSGVKFKRRNRWAVVSLVCGLLGLGVGASYFLRSGLPLGLYNSLSPASAAADWLWGWGLLAAVIATIGAFKPNQRPWTVGGIALAVTLVVASYRIDAT